ncbi:MAG TPA: hypothetical protein VEC37_10490 [Bacillota bacterium]|nr:hypothetical protein [Bacillota bacterium]
MSCDYKPTYLEFLRLQLSFKKKRYIQNNNEDYIENRKTEKIAKLSYMIIIIIMITADSFQLFSRFGSEFKLLLGFSMLIVLYFVFETVHWFYAEFDLIKKEDGKE